MIIVNMKIEYKTIKNVEWKTIINLQMIFYYVSIEFHETPEVREAATKVVNIKNTKYYSFYINLPKASNITDFTTFAIQIYIASDMLCLNIQVF